MQMQHPLEICSFHLRLSSLELPDRLKGTALEICDTQTFVACWDLVCQVFSPEHVFFNGWIIQPRNIEFRMKMLPGFYLQ